MMRAIRLPQLGLAIDARRIVAVSEGAAVNDVWARDLAPADLGGGWPELIQPLQVLREYLASSAGRSRQSPSAIQVSIALVPPLVQVRTIELPFLRRGDLLKVLERDAARHFFLVRGEQVIAIRHLQRTRSRRTVLAAAAPRWLIELLAREFTVGQLRLRQIVPAHASWSLAMGRQGKTRASPAWLGVPCGEVLELLALRGTTVTRVRRVRSTGDEAMVRRFTGVLPPNLSTVTQNEPAITVAARHAVHVSMLSLVPPSIENRELQQWRRVTTWLLGAAAALLAAIPLLRMADLGRELAHVRNLRQEIRHEITPAMHIRSTVSAIESRVRLLCEIRDLAPRWSNAIVTVAADLPFDAHLAQLSAAGDSLLLEGAAEQASGVFEQLRAAPGIRSLHATAPIRHESGDGLSKTEYFAIMLRMESAGSVR